MRRHLFNHILIQRVERSELWIIFPTHGNVDIAHPKLHRYSQVAVKWGQKLCKQFSGLLAFLNQGVNISHAGS